MKKDDVKYTVCTEGSDYNFPYLRVMLLSLLKHSPWLKDNITVMTCELTPLSKHNKEILKGICQNIQFYEIDSSKLSSLNIKNSDKNGVLLSLYRLFSFDLTDLDLVIYISSFNLCISDIPPLFKGDSDIILSNSIIQIKNVNKKNQFSNKDNPHTNVMMFSKEALNKNIFEKSLDILNKKRNLNRITIDSIVLESLRFKKVSIDYWNNNQVVKKSRYNDSKFKSFLAIKKSVCIINMDIELNRRSKTQSHFMFKKINSIWTGYNKQGDWYTESINHSTLNENINSHLKRLKNRNINKNVVKRFPRAKKSEYAIDPNKQSVSNKEFNILIESNASNSTINNLYETAVVIAFKNRHSMVELNVKCLDKQTLKPAAVLVVSNLSDYNFAIDLKSKYSNVFICLHENYPMGAKWNAGVKYAQKLKVKGLMILGSDDLISLDYIKHCYEAVDQGNGSNGKGVDLIGNRSWYIYDTTYTLYHLSYTKNVKILLGGGKMFSKNFLDSVDWNIFISSRHKHLDTRGYELVKKFSNSISVINPEHFILSIKGKWEVINATNAILKATRRISHRNVSSRINQIEDSLKITNINDYIR